MPQNAISYHTKFAWFNWNYNNKIWVEYVPNNARGGGDSGTITINRNRILCRYSSMAEQTNRNC